MRTYAAALTYPPPPPLLSLRNTYSSAQTPIPLLAYVLYSIPLNGSFDGVQFCWQPSFKYVDHFELYTFYCTKFYEFERSLIKIL